MFLLQMLLTVILAGAAVLGLTLQAERTSERDARLRSLDVAQTFSHSPGLAAALSSRDPTAILQPLATEIRHLTGVDYVAVLNNDGIRYTAPISSQIGTRAVGDLRPALAGRAVTQPYQGLLNSAVRALVPVVDSHGTVVGVVAAGVTVESVAATVDRQLPLLLGSTVAGLTLATGGTALLTRRLRRQTRGLDPAEMTRMYEHHDAVLHAVREGVLIVNGEGRLLLANDEARRLLDLPADAEQQYVRGLGLDPSTAALLSDGRIATDEVHLAGDRLLAINQRPTDSNGGPPGAVATVRDTTELHALAGRAELARERLRLLYEAGVRVGTTLDMPRTARELAEVAVPRFADIVTVDLLTPVLRGEEPDSDAPSSVCRIAAKTASGCYDLYPEDASVSSAMVPWMMGSAAGGAALLPELCTAPNRQQADAEHTAAAPAARCRSLITAPLLARGILLGRVDFWRAQDSEPFEEDDLSFAEELVARAAVCIDNARRYTREHSAVVTLQRSLLPRRLPEQNAVQVAYRYLPATATVGGAWFDVIALPGARVALVVGDVVGHGLHAAATMGRLRTAVHSLTAMDLPPDEVLYHLDQLVALIGHEENGSPESSSVAGATCLYAIYDPACGRCAVARAGHLAPVVTLPGGTVDRPTVPDSLPLGLSGAPFETTEFPLPDGSQLVLCTNGLLTEGARDTDRGFDLLCSVLAYPSRTPEQTCAAILTAMLPAGPGDDVALLVAGTRRLSASQVAEWNVPGAPAAVADIRAQCTRQLAEWSLQDLELPAELILSELVTNAIRYGAEPITVRLLYDRFLTIEVADASSTSPHLRRAATTDEGGRGLFIVAQLAERWGTRYPPQGKIIWAELEPLAIQNAEPDGGGDSR
ncbi:SpoIIE family protein phosphatase (plasmid) [Streptomyces murinus]|uniref:SpoIIE family protein phosphatase n=1 Tax=Streptomyces murinus TaxID=33900 RepID=UPI000A23DF22|nr:SpoIIE family protein phosphatase [Streptomyces murinus]WDO11221.1 SpoIIE family protein phosphatase [Streptomyces murinus]